MNIIPNRNLKKKKIISVVVLLLVFAFLADRLTDVSKVIIFSLILIISFWPSTTKY